MQALLTPLHELAYFSEMQEMLKKKKCISVSGCVDSQKLHMIYGLSDGFKYKIIVTYSDLRAREIFEEYKFYDKNVMLYPAKDLIFFIFPSPLLSRSIISHKKTFSISNPDKAGFFRFLLPSPILKGRIS